MLTWGILRWIPEQFKQMKIPRLWDAQSGSESKKERIARDWIQCRKERWGRTGCGRGVKESPGPSFWILKISKNHTSKTEIRAIDSNTN